jgi:zinc protease
VALTWKGSTLPVLLMGFHTPAFSPRSADVPALEVLSELLFSQRAPLYKRLVLKEQKVEALDGSFEWHVDPNLFTVYARIKKAKDLPAVQEAVEEQIARVAKEGVEERTLSEIVAHVRYGFAGRLDTPDHVALVGAEFIALTGRLSSIDEYFAALRKVTTADVKRVARATFVPRNRTVVTLKAETP